MRHVSFVTARACGLVMTANIMVVRSHVALGYVPILKKLLSLMVQNGSETYARLYIR